MRSIQLQLVMLMASIVVASPVYEVSMGSRIVARQSPGDTLWKSDGTGNTNITISDRKIDYGHYWPADLIRSLKDDNRCGPNACIDEYTVETRRVDDTTTEGTYLAGIKVKILDSQYQDSNILNDFVEGLVASVELNIETETADLYNGGFLDLYTSAQTLNIVRRNDGGEITDELRVALERVNEKETPGAGADGLCELITGAASTLAGVFPAGGSISLSTVLCGIAQ